MIYMKAIKTVNPKSSRQKEKYFFLFNIVTLWNIFTKHIGIIISWSMLHQYDVYYEPVQYSMSIISQ